jgi:hypothetical protein
VGLTVVAREEAARRQGGKDGGTMATTNVFAVIGEHREQPEKLLLLGGDGRFYTYVSAKGPPVQVEPTEEWELDEVVVEGLFV